MSPLDLWEHNLPIKTLYSVCVDPVCKKYHINRTELDILLFLANNPQYDTAADIVEVRYLAKSHVSAGIERLAARGYVSISIKELERLGYLKGRYQEGNHKTIHLVVQEEAKDVVIDGRMAQQEFFNIMFHGIKQKEVEQARSFFNQVSQNIRNHLESREKV